MIPAFSYSMVFLLAGVFISIEIPQLFVEQFGFTAEQIGLQNISIIIGTLIGEQIGGFMSDKWMAHRKKRTWNVPPEFRLWISYPGYALAIVGVIVFLVQLQNAGAHWNITPLAGAGIAAGGMQIVTTVLVTYAIDCYPSEASSVGTFITFVRQTWGFIGPFCE
jgi:MFS family permease